MRLMAAENAAVVPSSRALRRVILPVMNEAYSAVFTCNNNSLASVRAFAACDGSFTRPRAKSRAPATLAAKLFEDHFEQSIHVLPGRGMLRKQQVPAIREGKKRDGSLGFGDLGGKKSRYSAGTSSSMCETMRSP